MTPLSPEIYRAVLDHAGYHSDEPTEAAVREMFGDYVDAGCISNVDLEDIPEISIQEICNFFLALDRREKRREAKKTKETPICTFTHFSEHSEQCSTESKSPEMTEYGGISQTG